MSPHASDRELLEQLMVDVAVIKDKLPLLERINDCLINLKENCRIRHEELEKLVTKATKGTKSRFAVSRGRLPGHFRLFTKNQRFLECKAELCSGLRAVLWQRALRCWPRSSFTVCHGFRRNHASENSSNGSSLPAQDLPQ